MPKRYFAFTGLLLGMMLALLIFAPAQWLGSAIAHFSGGRVQLQDSRGSVWRGEADLLLTGGLGSREQRIFGQSAPCPFAARSAASGGEFCQRVHWRLRPRWLGFDLTLGQPCCLARGALLRLRWNGASRMSAEMLQWRLKLGAEFLSGLGAPWNTLDPEGEAELTAERFRIERTGAALRFEGGLRITLRGVTSRLSTLKPLGSYELQFAPAPDSAAALALQLSSDMKALGALRLEGSGRWSAQTGLRFEGSAEPARAEDEAALTNLLSIMGRREGRVTRLVF